MLSLQEAIKTAKKICEKDGYDQLIVQESDGSLGIKRAYPDCIRLWEEPVTVLKYIEGKYKEGVFSVEVKEPTREILEKVKEQEQEYERG